MPTPDWTSEIVEAMAKELRALPRIHFSYGGAEEAAKAALAAALPMILEKAAKECDEQAQDFLSPQYATHQPLSSLEERFACRQCATRIRALASNPEGMNNDA